MPPNNTQSIKRKYINLNPSPTIRGLIKVHKADSQSDLLSTGQMPQHINWPKSLSKNLEIFIHYHTHNLKNTIYLMEDLLEITFNKDLKFISFDITHMYSHVHMKELIKITFNVPSK